MPGAHNVLLAMLAPPPPPATHTHTPKYVHNLKLEEKFLLRKLNCPISQPPRPPWKVFCTIRIWRILLWVSLLPSWNQKEQEAMNRGILVVRVFIQLYWPSRRLFPFYPFIPDPVCRVILVTAVNLFLMDTGNCSWAAPTCQNEVGSPVTYRGVAILEGPT